MTSLIDVIFLLLLFFMLSSTFSRFSELDLSAAGAGPDATTESKPLFLRVAPTGLSLNGEALTLDALAGAVRVMAEPERPRPVLIALAPRVDAQRLTDVLVVLRGVPGLMPQVLGGDA